MYLEEKFISINMNAVPLDDCPFCMLSCSGQCQNHCKGCQGSKVRE